MKQVKKQEVLNAEVPQSTETYTAVPNEKVIEILEHILGYYGYEIKDEIYKTDKNRGIFFGNITLTDGNEEANYNLGWVNSYDKSRRFGIAIGAKVFACSNLDFCDLRLMRKHTKYFWHDFNTLINGAVISLTEKFNEVTESHKSMRKISINDDDIASLIGELFYKQKIIRSTQLNQLVTNLQTKKYFGKETLFDFYMHLTNALADSHPRIITDNYVKARNVIVSKINALDGQVSDILEQEPDQEEIINDDPNALF